MLTRGQWEYNPAMLSNTVVRVRIPPLLDAATYISLMVMSLIAARELPTLRAQLTLFGLCAVCGLLYNFVFRAGRYEKNPVLYFGSQLVILILLLLLRPPSVDGINFIFLIISIHAALVLTRNTASLWIAVYFLAVSTFIFMTSGADGFVAVSFYLVVYVICGVFGRILQQADLARQHNQQLIEELKSTQQKLQDLAVLEERNRLARDLHDSVKQQVFAISMQLSAARAALAETDKAYSSVTEAERLAQQAGAELTSLINALRPPSLERKSFLEAIREHVGEWSKQTNIEVKLTTDDELPLNTNEEQVFFRVIQEALSNVARHSQATHVGLELIHVDSQILFCIADNGTGFDFEQIQGGVGLQSMRERLAQIGATFHVLSGKDIGTQITAKLERS